MDHEQVIREANSGNVLPVYVVVGEERVYVDRVITALRNAALRGGEPDFNRETLTAGEVGVDAALAACRTLPMMAARRFVLVRSVDRWEASSSKSVGKDGKEAQDAKNAKESKDGKEGKRAKNSKEHDAGSQSMDRLLAYLAHPVDTTCLVLLATKLDRRRKLASVAKKYTVECESPTRQDLPKVIQREFSSRGKTVSRDVADFLAEIVGSDLSAVIDAVERLSLYTGDKTGVTEDDVVSCVTRVRMSTPWDFLAAVDRRDIASALSILSDVYEPQDRGLRLVALLAWSTRQLLRYVVALRAGATPTEAATRAGAPPAKARELAGQVRGMSVVQIENWIQILAQTDLALKRSRRPASAILESAILTMTGTTPM